MRHAIRAFFHELAGHRTAAKQILTLARDSSKSSSFRPQPSVIMPSRGGRVPEAGVVSFACVRYVPLWGYPRGS